MKIEKVKIEDFKVGDIVLQANCMNYYLILEKTHTFLHNHHKGYKCGYPTDFHKEDRSVLFWKIEDLRTKGDWRFVIRGKNIDKDFTKVFKKANK